MQKKDAAINQLKEEQNKEEFKRIDQLQEIIQQTKMRADEMNSINQNK